jgi:hypothetical protein
LRPTLLSIRSILLFVAAGWLLPPLALHAQQSDNTEAAAKADASPKAPPDPADEEIDKRIFGILPNYRTADGSVPFAPISTKQKYSIAAKDTFDYPVYFLAAAFAGLYQMDNQNPSFGQGVEGYAKRLGASFADQAIGNMMTEAIFPSLLRQDPRYFLIGPGGGTGWHRASYALTRVFVTRDDKGRNRFNYSEWLGNGTAVAISNLYYPSDTRHVTDNLEKLGVQVAADAFSQVLKEFWPDIKRKLSGKK